MGLGEAKAARTLGVGPGERDRVIDALRALDLVQAPRAGEHVDHAPLPSDAADAPVQA